jgi:RNA polymerase sigma-70 factor (ECF subfamily)
MEAQVDEINLEYLKKNRELENIDISERIIKAVDKLPDQARVIFKLKRQEGRTYDEIAKELNISINTVRKQMSRALTKLRQELADLLKNNESRMG